jgi:hypothetical protein
MHNYTSTQPSTESQIIIRLLACTVKETAAIFFFRQCDNWPVDREAAGKYIYMYGCTVNISI